MMRGPRGTNADVLKRKIEGNERVTQYSTILGSVAANPVMRRPYPNVSNVHRNKKAQTFVKAMWGACLEAELIVKKLTPHLYKRQIELFEDVKDEWKFGTMYTSSISNFNISAAYHRDRKNLEGTVNMVDA